MASNFERHLSPLRYPGGKSKLTRFVKLLFQKNELLDGDYAEPYAGGASVALGLVLGEYASVAHINDLDLSIHTFWHAVLNDTEALCRRISLRPVTLAEWRRQRAVQKQSTIADPLDLAFSTFFLNRTNRSGIIASGGVIGGNSQNGDWAIDARYNKSALIQRIERIARYRDRISLTRLDATDFLKRIALRLPSKSLTYLDPPYYVQGQQRLYASYYRPEDHAAIARQLTLLRRPWIVSYDNAPQIQTLYKPYRSTVYGVRYTAADRYRGAEIMVFSPELRVPGINPTAVTDDDIAGAA
jgi:DNA adenine methylase